MKMLRKIIDGKSLKIFQENVYEGVSFSKVTNLLCSDCNFAIKTAHHKHFLEYVSKTLKVLIYSQVNVFGGGFFSLKLQV